MDYIILSIQNNTAFKVPVFLLGNAADPAFNADNNTLVEWDLSTENFIGNSVTITTVPPFTVPLTEFSIAGVVNALNTLNLAIFDYQGTTIYATYLTNPTLAAADINIDNIPFNIDGWIQVNSLSNAFTAFFRDAEFSHDGQYYFVLDTTAVNNLDRFPLGTAWDISTIALVADQTISDATPLNFTFGNSGLFWYRKPSGGGNWTRNPVGVAYDLTTVAAIDQSQGLSVTAGGIGFNPTGLKFWNIGFGTIIEYTAGAAWSILAPAQTSRLLNDFVPNEGATFVGRDFAWSIDGTKLFILKSEGSGAFGARIYQCTCSIPFTVSSAIYDNVVVAFNASDTVYTLQFNDIGTRFLTTEGFSSQIIREFG